MNDRTSLPREREWSESLATALEIPDLFALEDWARGASVSELEAVGQWVTEKPWEARGNLRQLVVKILRHGVHVPEVLFGLVHHRSDLVAPLLRNPSLTPSQTVTVCREGFRRMLDPLTDAFDIRDIGNALQELGSGPGFPPEFLEYLVNTIELLHAGRDAHRSFRLTATGLTRVLRCFRSIPQSMLLRLARSPVLDPAEAVAFLLEFASDDPVVWKEMFKNASWPARGELIRAAVERKELMNDAALREAVLTWAAPDLILAYLPLADLDAYGRLLIKATEVAPELVAMVLQAGEIRLPGELPPQRLAPLLSSDRAAVRVVGFALLGALHGERRSDP